MLTNEIAVFAARFNISAADAFVLPALFEHSANLAKMPLRSFVAEATYRNNPLGEYLASAARKVAAEDRAEHA